MESKQEKKTNSPRKIKPQDLYPPKQPSRKKLSKEERSYKKEDNLASQKRELAEARIQANQNSSTADPTLSTEPNPDHMSRKELRKYHLQQERQKLSEMSFWRKLQYILMYYSFKFLAVIAGILIIVFIAKRIYIISCPIALDAVLINDITNTTFEPTVIELYTQYNEVPERSRFLIDSNMEFDPNSTEVTTDMTFYTKIGSVLTSNSTQVIISDPDIVKYYAADGYIAELQNCLPDDLFSYFRDRLYSCNGPFINGNYYAVDLTGTRFAELTELHLEHPMYCIPSCTDSDNREIAFNFLRMIRELEESQ